MYYKKKIFENFFYSDYLKYKLHPIFKQKPPSRLIFCVKRWEGSEKTHYKSIIFRYIDNRSAQNLKYCFTRWLRRLSSNCIDDMLSLTRIFVWVYLVINVPVTYWLVVIFIIHFRLYNINFLYSTHVETEWFTTNPINNHKNHLTNITTLLKYYNIYVKVVLNVFNKYIVCNIQYKC